MQEEIARGKVAEQEWLSVRNVAPPELGLRKPQLAKEQANVKAAEAKLERAKRNLSRTQIKAPYNGIVVERNIDLGQFVTTGATLGTLYSTDTAEVRLPITDSDLMFVDIAGQSKQGAPIALSANVGGVKRTWQGTLIRSEGVLDTQSRVIYAVVEVEDPYNLQASHSAPLRFGQFVEAEITSRQTEKMFVIPRNNLRLDNTVLTVNDEREIEIKDVEVARTTASKVYLRGGLDEGTLVVTSAVPNPFNGMKVRLPGDAPISSKDSEDNTNDEGAVVSEASTGGEQ